MKTTLLASAAAVLSLSAYGSTASAACYIDVYKTTATLEFDTAGTFGGLPVLPWTYSDQRLYTESVFEYVRDNATESVRVPVTNGTLPHGYQFRSGANSAAYIAIGVSDDCFRIASLEPNANQMREVGWLTSANMSNLTGYAFISVAAATDIFGRYNLPVVPSGNFLFTVDGGFGQ